MNTDGSVDSTVEINDSTTNGPDLGNDQFGFGIANIGDLDGNGVNDLAVGAVTTDGSTDRGAVHIIFLNSDGTLTKQSVVINDSTTNGPDLEDSDYFGAGVEKIGDLDGNGVNDLAVGAEFDDGAGTDRGALHIIFLNSDGTLTKQSVEINDSTIDGPTLSDNDRFGSSVADIGDLDGNGVNDLAVGAYLDDGGGSNRGAVHIIFMDENSKYTVTITESVSLTDETSKAAGVNLSESVSLTDSIAKSAGVNLSESVSLTDSISKAAGVNLSDTVLLTDSISKAAGVNLSESVSLTDSIAKAAGVNLTESVSLTDSISKAAGVNLSESVSLTDSIIKGSWCESIRICIVDRLDCKGSWCEPIRICIA